MSNTNKFYVYEWFNINTNEVFYVGKGCGKRAFETKKRNKIFLKYYETYPCDVRLVFQDLSEEEAFKQEKILTDFYKKKDQCQANLADAGYGGVSQVWTPELKQYWSENNPMKQEEQRLRMSIYNPMKNPEVAKKVGQTKKRAVIINGVKYDGLVDAAKDLQVCTDTILTWVKQGHNSKGEPCRYADEEEKNFIIIKPGRPILIDGIYYETGVLAAKAIGVTPAAVSYALKHSGICKGHKCEYANQQPS